MRQILSTAIVAVLVSLLTLTVAGAVAQEPAEQQVSPAAVSKINADKVDGKNAVSATKKTTKRAGKLVATNVYGYLPSNIIKLKWSLIQGKPASFADDQIGWYEVANKPAGFADNTDNVGVAQVQVQQVKKNGTFPKNAYGDISVTCPSGYVVTGGGLGQAATDVRVLDNNPWGESGWIVSGLNLGGSDRAVTIYAVCMKVTK